MEKPGFTMKGMKADRIDSVISPYWTFNEEITCAVLTSRITPKCSLEIRDIEQPVEKNLKGLGEFFSVNGMMQSVRIE